MNKKSIEQRAAALLQETGIQALPIDVEEVARQRGLQVVPHDLGEGVSGALFIDGGVATIGYNPHHHDVRQRFTIAHELGHYELHARSSPLFVDRGFVVAYRDGRSSTGEVLKERQANAFAAALLMPADAIREAIQDFELDLTAEDEVSLRPLAQRFGVSVQALTFRILNLNVLE